MGAGKYEGVSAHRVSREIQEKSAGYGNPLHLRSTPSVAVTASVGPCRSLPRPDSNPDTHPLIFLIRYGCYVRKLNFR